jgi:hypothetical protein
VVQVPHPGTLTNAQEVQALRIRLEDLKDQLQDAASRRRTISEQLRSADISARPGIEARMGELDSRILRLERDISETGKRITDAPAAALIAGTATQVDPAEMVSRVTSEIVPIVAILSVFVLAPFAIAISRFIWKRSAPAPRPALVDQATQQRFEQLQQAVDTIAVEVERISEGQRFVTKLLSERERPALGVGAAEPARAAKSPASVPRERGEY